MRIFNFSIIIFLLLYMSTSDVLFAQKRDDNQKNELSMQSPNMSEDISLEERINRRKISLKGLFELDVTEDWIKPEKYFLGSGDIIALNFIGGMNKYLETIITPEGYVNIPGFCSIDVKNKTLLDFKRIVDSQIGQNVEISLVEIRPIKIYILGEVEYPGAYIAKPTERMFDAIVRAGDFKYLANIDSVFIYRKQDTLCFNGNQYFKKGNINANPQIQDRDIIFVPKCNAINQTVTVQGAVNKSGLYPIVEGENLWNFIINRLEFAQKVGLKSIKLTRTDNGKQEIMVFQIDSDEVEPKLQKTVLNGGDIIEIDLLNDIYVQGEVNNPGSFPYVSGFKVQDYLGLAGGNKETANLNKVTIISNNGKQKVRLYSLVSRGDVIVVPKSVKTKFIGEESLLSILSTLITTLLTIQLIRMG
ncbi:MAG: SLBB domain-containing protein [Candidatus Marinimicrobia bacterium]|nr:SLBB domain-containing protein [Candidatus Neomarinimicrobiota bacterium]